MEKSPDSPVLAQVGGRLRQARLAQGMNLHQLARLTGISAPALSLIETGKRDLRLSTLDRLATALRMPLCDLLRPADARSADTPSAAAPGEGYDLGDYR